MQAGIALGNIASVLNVPTEESGIVSELKAGSEEAFAWLIAKYHQPIYSLIARTIPDAADAADLTQDVFIKIYRGISGFNGGSSLRTWIYRIAVRCALDRISGPRIDQNSTVGEESDPQQHEVQVADLAAGPDRLLLSGEIGAMQEMAMLSLTPTERTAFVLRHMEDCSSEQIATALGIEPNAAKQAVFRAVQKLRLRLAILRVKI